MQPGACCEQGATLEILCGDYVETMNAMEPDSIDAIVTDPPYGLEFMGKEWDRLGDLGEARSQPPTPTAPGQSFSDRIGRVNFNSSQNVRCRICGHWKFSGTPCECEEPDFPSVLHMQAHAMQEWHADWARAAFRVLKPGGHLIAFGGSRTYHRMACAVEDAGFEIRDQIMWLYGSGFPKSLDVSKAIDKQRHDLEQIYAVTAWIRGARDAAGIKNTDIDAAFGFAGMAGHWTSANSQPAVPTLEQVPTLLEALGNPEIPEDMAELLITLNGRKGQPGAAWFRREIIGKQKQGRLAVAPGQGEDRSATVLDITASATDAAREWQGWGTALKPAHEPIVVARKPLIGTVTANLLRHGTGALNVEGCRIDGPQPKREARGENENSGLFGLGSRSPAGLGMGRWPANVILDEAAGAMLDEQSGEIPAGKWPAARAPSDGISTRGMTGQTGLIERIDQAGGAARFFYCPKASREEREEGLNRLQPSQRDTGRKEGNPGGDNPRNRGVHKRYNHHPTVKPVALMRYLIRLVTPPGGTVLDPFLGSGTTLVAAALEGVDAIGIEREEEYVEIARARIAHTEHIIRELARQLTLGL